MFRHAMYAMVTAAALTLLTGCFKSGIELRNLTGSTLTPYPVVTNPPPPHREADANNAVPPGGTTPIEPGGFNPMFYTPGVTDPGKANALYLGLDLANDAPYQILYRTFHHLVPPGQEGSDPALQPKLLHEKVETVMDKDLTITVGPPTDLANPTPGGWSVTIKEN